LKPSATKSKLASKSVKC